MTDKEKELVKNYPEAAAFAGAAASVWNGNTSPAKIEMVVKGKWKSEHSGKCASQVPRADCFQSP